MKIFITGGTGFIGQPLVKKLQERGHNLRLLCRDPEKELSFLNTREDVNIIKGDLSNLAKWDEEVREFSPEACVHLAWEGLPDYNPEQNQKNLNYTKNLFEFLKKIKCERVVSAGSAWEIQVNSSEKEFTMIQSPPLPTDNFVQTKIKIKELGKSMFDKFIWGRIHFVYGPGQRTTSLIPYLVKCAKIGENPEIKKPSDRNDYIYINDVAAAFVVLVNEVEQTSEYDICSGKYTQTQEIVNIVASQLEKKEWIKKLDSWIGRIMEHNMNEKLRVLGWVPEVDLESGIKKAINFYWNNNY